MKYACLVYQEEAKLAALGDAEPGEIVAGCIAWVEDLERSGIVEVRPLLDPHGTLADPFDRKVAALIARHARPMSDAQAARTVSAGRT